MTLTCLSPGRHAPMSEVLRIRQKAVELKAAVYSTCPLNLDVPSTAGKGSRLRRAPAEAARRVVPFQCLQFLPKSGLILVGPHRRTDKLVFRLRSVGFRVRWALGDLAALYEQQRQQQQQHAGSVNQVVGAKRKAHPEATSPARSLWA